MKTFMINKVEDKYEKLKNLDNLEINCILAKYNGDKKTTASTLAWENPVNYSESLNDLREIEMKIISDECDEELYSEVRYDLACLLYGYSGCYIANYFSARDKALALIIYFELKNESPK